MRVLPPPGGRAGESGEYVGMLLQRLVGGVVEICVELNARVPEPEVDPLGAERPKSAHVREPAADGVDLARHERHHVAAHHDDLHVGLLDLVLDE